MLRILQKEEMKPAFFECRAITSRKTLEKLRSHFRSARCSLFEDFFVCGYKVENKFLTLAFCGFLAVKRGSDMPLQGISPKTLCRTRFAEYGICFFEENLLNISFATRAPAIVVKEVLCAAFFQESAYLLFIKLHSLFLPRKEC